MYYPQELIEEIRMQNDIVATISAYVPLKQKGSTYFGLCPFHNEKSPSFSVSPDKQFYYCFGCGAAGNVYSFIMRIENCDFPEAVQILAQKAHIALPEKELSPQEKQKEKLRQRIFELHKAAGLFYYSCLNEAEGKAAKEYLEQRRISPAIQKKFGLGYSPAGFGRLRDHLNGLGYTREEMEKSGLVLPDKSGNEDRDRFFNRLMFPIFDVMGRCIGFGGRILAKGEPKYLNSPETMIFNKGKNLYGLNLAKKTKLKEMILVEGYMDMISIYQAGFHNVAASLGTAFTVDHARLLKKYVDSAILLYDSDEAGTNAALRAIPILVSEGFRVKVLQVPDGKDPDEYIKQKGAQAFGKLLLQAQSYILFQINCIRGRYNMHNTEHKVLFTTDAAGILARLDNAIERDAYIKEIASYTGISQDAIEKEIQKVQEKNNHAFASQAEKKRVQQFAESAVTVRKNAKGIHQAQRDILALCATDAEFCSKVKECLKPEEFQSGVYEKMAGLIYEFHSKKDSIFPAELVNYFESVDEQKTATEIFALTPTFDTPKDMEKAVNENIKLIKRTNIDEMAAKAASIDDVFRLTEAKRKLDELYITISDG